MSLKEPREARTDVFVSVVALVDEGIVEVSQRVRDIGAIVAQNYRNYEVIVVDNGLTNDTLAALRELLTTVPCIRVVRLLRRSTADTAAFAGIEAAIGDIVVVHAVAFDPPPAVLKVAESVRRGSDVVQGVSRERLAGNLLTQVGRRAFYAYNRRFLGIDIPARSTYLIGLTRRAVNSLGASARSQRYLRHLIQHIGYRIDLHEYSMLNRSIVRESPVVRGISAVEMISSYSTHPLRVVAGIGLIGALVNLTYAVYVIAVTVLRSNVAEGWPTTSLQLSVMFFVLCLVLAVQAEYLARILSESRREPAYFILEEFESDRAFSEMERRNVTED